MPIKDYSTDPDLNVQISGINIAEGCPPSGINNAIRQLMADVKVESEAKAEAITAAGEALEAFAGTQAAKDEEQDEAISTAQASADAAQAKADQAYAKESVLPGTVVAWAANSTPSGYLLCNGAAVSRTTYADLFAAIGTTYGTGDGSTTFNLPNLTDKFIQGSGTAGAYKEAGLPDINGVLSNVRTGAGLSAATGVFAGSEMLSNTTGGGPDGWSRIQIVFTASKANSTYGKSLTVQPPALTMRYYIKY